MPDVAGKDFLEARRVLNRAGFGNSIWGKDGKKWANVVPDESVKVDSTVPAAGTVTSGDAIEIHVAVTETEYSATMDAKAAAASAALEAAKLAKRYKFSCGATYSSTGSDTYKSLKEVWGSPHYAGSDTCTVTYDGEYASYKPAALPAEQKIADIVASSGGDASGAPIETYDSVLRLCAKVKPDYADQVPAKPEWKKAEAKAALALCPEAPHAALFQDVLTAVKVDSGTHTVGTNMEPGTYQTKPNMKDCYWSRTTPGGDIIANDFIGFAPAGVTVTVYPGEGFQAERCGVWTKTG